MLLLEAAVECRSSQKDEFNEKPPKISDAVAEGTIQCLEQLLMRCHVVSVEQMTVILKKLTNAALLSPLEASEEFREGVIRCFKALLLGSCLCSNTSCTCKDISGMPMLLEKSYPKPFYNVFPANEENSEECLLAFLRSESASVAVGHWLSLLLKAADVEASLGHTGSSKLRIEAFMTLRVLVAKDEGKAYCQDFNGQDPTLDPEYWEQETPMETRIQNSQAVRNSETHNMLLADLVDHLWENKPHHQEVPTPDIDDYVGDPE